MASYNTIPDLISSSVSVDLEKAGGYGSTEKHGSTSATIYPFVSPQRSSLRSCIVEFQSILRLKETKKILIFLCLNIMGTATLLLWCHDTSSMALTAYTYLTIFDIFSILTCLLSVWVRMQKPSPAYSFGYERFEVLATFASTMLAQLGALFIIKESIERIIQQPEIHTGRLLVGVLFAFMLHMFLVYSIDNRPLHHVMSASSSSWLQEHTTDISESICHIIPGLSKLLLPRINPLALIAFAGGFTQKCKLRKPKPKFICHIIPGLSKLLLPRINPLALIAFARGFIQNICHIIPGLSKLLLPRINPLALIAFARGFIQNICHIIPGLSKLLLPRINPLALIAFAGGFMLTITHILIDTKNYYSCDTIAAMFIAIMTCGTMFPMAVYTGKILLQTTPAHLLGQLDKVLREASTLDGVLEFREEHFWTLSFGSLAGSVQVRVRRDANEQLVLAHVYNRLSNLVSHLTIQIFKDDWTRAAATTYNFMGANPVFSQHSGPSHSPTRGPSPTQDLGYSPIGAGVGATGAGAGTMKPMLLSQQFGSGGDYQSTYMGGVGGVGGAGVSSGMEHSHSSQGSHRTGKVMENGVCLEKSWKTKFSIFIMEKSWNFGKSP